MKLQYSIKLYLVIFTILTIGMLTLFIYHLLNENTIFNNSNTISDSYVFISTRNANDINNISNTIDNVTTTIENTVSIDSASNLKQLYIALGVSAGFILLFLTYYIINNTCDTSSVTDINNISNNTTSGTIPTFAATNNTENIELPTIVRNSNVSSVLSGADSSPTSSIFVNHNPKNN